MAFVSVWRCKGQKNTINADLLKHRTFRPLAVVTNREAGASLEDRRCRGSYSYNEQNTSRRKLRRVLDCSGIKADLLRIFGSVCLEFPPGLEVHYGPVW